MAYPVLADFKTFMGISGATYDTNLTTALEAAVAEAEGYTGRVFVVASSAKEFPVEWPYFDKARSRLNTMEEFTALTTLVNGDGVTITSADYVLYPVSVPYYIVTLNRDSGYFFWDGGDSSPVTVTADWGNSVDVPNDLKRAIMLLAQRLYYEPLQGAAGPVQSVGKSGLVTMPASMPRSVKIVLDRYRRAAL